MSRIEVNAESSHQATVPSRPLGTAMMISVPQIDPNPFQPRHDIDDGELNDLATSILENGILQPLLVCPHKDRFQLVAGYRRLSAAKLAGLDEVPCTVRVMTEHEMLRFALVENLQRNDLNPLEEGESIQKLMAGQNLTQLATAQLINKSEGFVNERLSLLKLPQELKARVSAGQLPLRKALEIGRLTNEASQLRLASRAESVGLEELHALVQKKLVKEQVGRKRHEKRGIQADFKDIVSELPNVRIYKDRISFTFKSENELLDLLEKLIKELKGEQMETVN